MTTVAIHQPQYLPWLPYLDKVDQVDVFVYLDTVQFERGGLQNRNQVKSGNGPLWLTVPVRSSLADRIMDVEVADQRWRKKHLLCLRQNYPRASHQDRLAGLEPLLSRDWERLVDLDIATTEWLFDEFGISTRRVRASELTVAGGIHKDDLVLAILQAVGAQRYLSGRGARAYQDPEKFERAEIELVYQSYESQPYRQCPPNAPFVPHYSAVDALFNEGPHARQVLLAGRLAPTSAEEMHAPDDGDRMPETTGGGSG